VEASWVEPGKLQAQEVSTGFGDVGLNANLTMFDALAVGIVPFGGFELFGKLGAVVWDADTDVTVDGETTFESDSGTDAVYGLGIGIRANKFTIRIEGEHFEVGAGDGIRIFSIGFHYTF
jgi:hypothetical protein